MSDLAYNSLPSPDGRFELKEVIGTGVCSKVYKAIDIQSNNRAVAIKIQRYEKDMITHINEEYRVLRDYSSHPNLPDFYGVYRKKSSDSEIADEVWFILELCEAGPVIDIIRSLETINKRINEEHLAYILRETAKAIVHLHENNVIHRDIRGSNILMTKEGEIKLCDFGLSRDTRSTNGKRKTCIGSCSWMAPEIIASAKGSSYDSRADVWALGITAIELADGKAPFADMHPTRAMFQILRNPPPTLYRQSNWSQNFNDFILECLEKNHDHRPFLIEVMEHPFFTELPSNDYYLSQELKILYKDVETINFPTQNETIIHNGLLKTHDNKIEKLYVEDLAALEKLSDDTILDEVKNRFKNGSTYSYIGDVLLSLNPNKEFPIYDRKFHNRYLFKSRSDNAPHIFAVADSAYQDMMHHEEQQYIIFSGESYSGKTANMRLCFEHLIVMGEGNAGIVNRLQNALLAVNALTHAGTPLNNDSTRCILQTQMTFGTTGKLSGAIFYVYLLEKTRVSTTDMTQSNFHLFYYFYDAMDAEERLNDFSLDGGRQYRYLRVPDKFTKSNLHFIRDDPLGNTLKFKDFEQALLALDISQDTLEEIYKILAAILLLGEVRFKDSETDRRAALVDPDIVNKIAPLLKIDAKKLSWAFVNYCILVQGDVEKRRMTTDQARDARDVLAGTLYSRLVDYVVNLINQKLAYNRAIFGDINSIILMDLFGFECFPKNQIEQLFVNCINEQMQYHYNQRVFVWEMLEQEEEHLPVTKLNFYDNKIAVDHLMNTPKGLFHIIDDATRGQYTSDFITDTIGTRKSPYLQRYSATEFSVAHYSGKINYNTRDFIEKNRDFLPPEMMETMRLSECEIVKTLFTNPLSKSGNLTMAMTEIEARSTSTSRKGAKWANALVNEKIKNRKMNTLSHGQYSQIHRMRTMSAVFRAASLEILKNLSVISNSGGIQFVRCVRCDLDYREMNFNEDIVRQQLRAMAILDTARARQKGFSVRIPFQEFLRRYKFLAFDFDENVEMTKDNCRLLLVRLKMEGWIIGTSKVFLKYYNEEFLARLYETQVKKIIKVQSMMRAFLAKKNIANKFKQLNTKQQHVHFSKDLKPEDAVLKIQTAFRGYQMRKKYGPLINQKTGKIDISTAKFIEPFATKWRNKSIFQILLQYRSVRHMDLVNFSQQVHIYNQRLMAGLTNTEQCILLEKIDPKEINKEQLGPIRRAVWKIPFRLDEIPYFDTKFLCDTAQVTNFTTFDEDYEAWDAPLQRRKTVSSHINNHLYNIGQRRESIYNDIDEDDGMIVNEPFSRDPTLPIRKIKARNIVYNPSPRQSISSPKPCEIRPYCISPTPYSQPSVGNLLQKFSADGSEIKPIVFKKRSAPKPPKSNEEKPSWAKKDPANRPTSPMYRQSKSDTIKEMESFGRKSSDEAETDDSPPFNFQAMLRKTKHNRNSLKRVTDTKLTLPHDSDYNNNSSEPYVETKPSYSSVVYHSKHDRPKSCNDGNNDNRPTSRKSSLSKETLRNKNGTDENDNMDFIQEEIAPGIVIEGYVAEL
ncbi:hypothetical protein PVAND_005739 [Polypedilum vanderplanki]|uniref:non-specific serine/threonine protein kinase n=1 Tax=Polypedilum vanderplanki TaxID=319348 RepID=A0A9J6C1E7_POLVA|nr:hypothetical protein PVAND_005739 [Polypedilum vanderplanki]